MTRIGPNTSNRTDKFGALGLSETLADSILRPSATLLLKIEALIKLIVEQRLEHTNFLQWISKSKFMYRMQIKPEIHLKRL